MHQIGHYDAQHDQHDGEDDMPVGPARGPFRPPVRNWLLHSSSRMADSAGWPTVEESNS